MTDVKSGPLGMEAIFSLSYDILNSQGACATVRDLGHEEKGCPWSKNGAATWWVEAETLLLPWTCFETHFCGLLAVRPQKGRLVTLSLSFPHCSLGKGLPS